MEVGESYNYREGRKGHGGGGNTFIGDRPVVGVMLEEGYFLRHFFGLKGGTFLARFPMGVPNILRGANGGAP